MLAGFYSLLRICAWHFTLDLFAIKQCVALYNLFAACLLNLRAKLTALTRLYHEPGEKPNISGPTHLRNEIRDLERIDYCQRAFLKTTERPVDNWRPIRDIGARLW